MIKPILTTLCLGLLITACSSNTYDDISEEQVIIEETVTYTTNVAPIINSNCVSCHAPGASASFRPLTTYTEVKNAVENAGLLNRIQLQNGQPGLMPASGRMPQNTIDILLQWNEDGLEE